VSHCLSNLILSHLDAFRLKLFLRLAVLRTFSVSSGKCTISVFAVTCMSSVVAHSYWELRQKWTLC
jgi:hypothetical protein